LKIEGDIILKRNVDVKTSVTKEIYLTSKCQDCKGDHTVFENPDPEREGVYDLTFVCYKCNYRVNISVGIVNEIRDERRV